MTSSAPPPEVDAVFAACPPPAAARLRALRGLILSAAKATGTPPLQETLKWGQPAYLPAQKHGTTLRLGWSDKIPEFCTLHGHCQTDLVSRWRVLFADAFTYDGNRTVFVPVSGDFPDAALQQLAAMALTYHRDKSQGVAP